MKIAGFAAVLLLGAAAAAEEPSLEESLPEDLPGRHDVAATLPTMPPEDAAKALTRIWFAQEEPRFEPWRAAMDGPGREGAIPVWQRYLRWLNDSDIEAKEFRLAAADWFVSRKTLTPEGAAEVTAQLRVDHAGLARLLTPAAEAGFDAAIIALGGNPAAREELLKLAGSDNAGIQLAAILSASTSRSAYFKELFEARLKVPNAEVRLHSLCGLLRLGDPKTLDLAREYLATPPAIRKFEIYDAVSRIRDPAALDFLLGQINSKVATEGKGLIESLARYDDPRVLDRFRKMRDDPRLCPVIVVALRRRGRAGDVPWLADRLDQGDADAAFALRGLLGRAVPIEEKERAAAVRRWIQEHAEAIEKDADLRATPEK